MWWLLWAGLAMAEEPTGAPPEDEDEGLPEDEDEPGAEPLDEPGTRRPVPPPFGRVRGTVGLDVGPAMPISGQGLGLLSRLELGLWLPPLGGRLMPNVALSWSAPSSSGTLPDETVEGTYTWTAVQRQLFLAPGLRARLSPAHVDLSPELSAAPVFAWTWTVVDGAIDGEPLARAIEPAYAIGWTASLGLGWTLGPGQLTAAFSATRVGLTGVVTGRVAAASLTPTVGYRISI